MSQGEKVKCTKVKKKVKGWSTEEMKDKQSFEIDTEEMIKLKKYESGRGGSMLEECLAERMEEKVLDKYNVENSKREAFKGRGAPLEWRRVRRSKKDKIRK